MMPQHDPEPFEPDATATGPTCPDAPRGWSRILAPGVGEAWPCNAVRRLLLLSLLIAVAGGIVLALPLSWHGHHPYDPDLSSTEQDLYDLSTHTLNCLFTAAAAFTGTGLHVYELGSDFSTFGQYAVLALMEMGGLIWLTLSTVAGWRLRAAMGWSGGREDGSHRAMIRVALVVLALAIVFQLIGTLTFLPSARDGMLSDDQEARPWLTAAFTSVSAWMNCGLTLRRNAWVSMDTTTRVYVLLAGLTWLGSLGGPVLYEIIRMPFRRARSAGRTVSPFLKLTVFGSVAMVMLGAGCLFLVESTTAAHWQLHDKAIGRPGHLATSSASAAPSTLPADAGNTEGVLVFSSRDSIRADRERLRSQVPARRFASSLFLSLQTGSTGMTPVRLDDDSIAPASRLILIIMMFAGGPLGGTAGGVRLMTVIVLAVALIRATRGATDDGDIARHRCFASAGVILFGMALLVTCVTLVLVYRQPDSLDRCLFEAVSACGNVGLSTGLTSALPSEDHTPGPLLLRLSSRFALILGMLLGRLLPLAVILRMTRTDRVHAINV